VTAARSFQFVHEAEDVVALAETEKAVLCRFIDGRPDAWVPLSQIDPLSDVQRRGDRGVLTTSRWFAVRAGWVRG
jgi:hypothetical protein